MGTYKGGHRPDEDGDNGEIMMRTLVVVAMMMMVVVVVVIMVKLRAKWKPRGGNV